LRRRLGAFKPNEEEFKSIYRLEQAFQNEWGRVKPTDASKLPAYNAAHEQLLAGIQQALGDQRYAQYAQAMQKDARDGTSEITNDE
jgi:hypothetical protein